jgi:ABC-type transport system involved in multi-copper enzyme maturation permease subunit
VKLIAAELLKMRRRTMTYVLLITLITVMAFVFLVVGTLLSSLLSSIGGGFDGESAGLPFNTVYAIAGDFVFGLGSLLVIIYTGGIVGGDYSWGVLRNVFSRGESRVAYALAKAAALAIVVSIGAAIAFVLGELMILVVASTAHFDFGSPFAGTALTDLAKALGLGLLVLFERAAIGFAVTVLLRSQVAGIVVGVVLYIAEPFISGIATALSALGSLGGLGTQTPQVHWSQFLPFSIGSSVLSEAHASLGSLSAAFTPVVPLAQSLPVLLTYGVIALVVGCFFMRRQEIVG